VNGQTHAPVLSDADRTPKFYPLAERGQEIGPSWPTLSDAATP